MIGSAHDPISLVAPSPAVSIQGTTEVRAQQGVATFTNVHISPSGAAVDLEARSPSAQGATSSLFALSPLPVTYAADRALIQAEMVPSSVTSADFHGDGNQDVALGDVDPGPGALQREALALVAQLADSPCEMFKAIGEGEDVRWVGGQVNAAALVVEHKAVHLCAFPLN